MSAEMTMIVTEEVVRDLLPLYFENEASLGSRVLVESWFAQDPAFARAARHGADAVGLLDRLEAPPLDEGDVREALRRVRRIVLVREVSLGFAGGLTILPFLLVGLALLFPTRIPMTPLDGLFALIVCGSLAALGWVTYFHVRGRTGSDLF